MYKYVINHHHNISIAVDSVNGLAAPNIKSVDKKSVAEIDKDIKEVAKLAN